jgi:starch-binding outer membrane protein, SusD/RagB family
MLLDKIFAVLILLILTGGCRKFVEVDPPVTNINAENVYESDATAAAVLTGIYTKMGTGLFGGLNALNLYPSLSADELTLFDGPSSLSTEYIPYYTNRLTHSNTGSADFTLNLYPIIFELNLAIEKLNNSSLISSAVKSTLLGEAKFMRAFCYFYLVNLYGAVPLAISSDYKVNSVLSNTSTDMVYAQIIQDLTDAQLSLTEGYMSGNLKESTADRVRPNKYAATALLARVYLYVEDYDQAILASTEIIENASMYDTVPVTDVFLKNNKEAIWQLFPSAAAYTSSNTQEASLYILPSTGPTSGAPYPVYLSNNVVFAFESDNDKRKKHWIDSVVVNPDPGNPGPVKTYYYPYKYKVAVSDVSDGPVQEYNVILRLGEQYLIRAEAKTQKGDFVGAAADLNVIRRRAGLPNTTASEKESLMASIIQERKIEFFVEWAHRWLDMKRLDIVDQIMPSIVAEKGGTWESTDKLYPFRLQDLQRNPNLEQNLGY